LIDTLQSTLYVRQEVHRIAHPLRDSFFTISILILMPLDTRRRKTGIVCVVVQGCSTYIAPDEIPIRPKKAESRG
jgi:hypothetical protein